MGTESQWSGDLMFRPPILASVFTGTPYDLDIYRERDIKLIVDREVEESIDDCGWSVTRTRRIVQGIAPAYRSAKSHQTQTQIQEVLDLLKKKAKTVRIFGYIERLTEDGDLSRLYVRDGKVIEAVPTITWPGYED